MKSFATRTLNPLIETLTTDVSLASSSHANNLFPSLDVNDLVTNLVPEQLKATSESASAPPTATEEVILKIPGSILHLIDKSYSVQLACGDLEILRLVQGPVFARVANDIQWPLTKDEHAVKLDESHYFFSDSSNGKEDMLNYGLTIASKGQYPLLEKLDRILTNYSSFMAVEKPNEKEVLDLTAAKETSPEELEGERKAMVEKQSTAYWTTLAPNVKDYSGVARKLIGAVFARVADEIQRPLTKDEPAVKVDESHNFLSDHSINKEDILNYGKTIASKVQEPLLTIASKVQEPLLENLDRILERKAKVEKQCMAHWTTLGPNVEDYNGVAPKLIAAGSGKLIKGILWCGDVTIDRLMWGSEFMKRRLTKVEKERQVGPATLNSIKRMKKMTKMTEKVANSVLSGIINFFLFFLSLMVNSKVGKKLFGLLLGEMVLATIDGFNKVFDAVEIAGSNVLKTSSTVTTEIIDHKYGAKMAHATNEGLGAAWHALETVWTVFNIRQAFNPKNAMKPLSLGDLEIRSYYERLVAAWHALGMAWTVFKMSQSLSPKNAMKPFSFAKTTTGDLDIWGYYERLRAVWHALGMAWTVFKISQALNPNDVMSPLMLAKIAGGL